MPSVFAGAGRSGEFGGGGHPVAEVADVRGLAAGFTLPGHQAMNGTRMPPSVRLRLMPVKGPLGLKRVEVVLALVVRAVVAGEDDERVLREAELLQVLQHAADIAVEPRDHRRLALVLLRPVLVRVGAVVGHMRAVAEDRGRARCWRAG